MPAQELQTIPASWPFACWGLDMIGPFKPAPGGFWYVYVAIDKFSKWIKYKQLVSATAKKAFELFEDIIHRFGLPNSIITVLGTTFIGHHFGRADASDQAFFGPVDVLCSPKNASDQATP